MALNGIESIGFENWGDTTNTSEVSFGSSDVMMEVCLSGIADTENSCGYISGILQYQTSNFFGGPTTHNFSSEAPWYLPNCVFDDNVINVTFYIDNWDDSEAFAAVLGHIFFS